MKPYPCIESTIDFSHKGTTIRLWVDQEEVKEKYDDEADIGKILTDLLERDLSRKEIYEEVKEKIPGVAACQLIDQVFETVVGSHLRMGAVVYFTSFETDPHG